MAQGIRPKTLLAQVRNTASWALEGDASEAAPWRAVLLEGDALDERMAAGEGAEAAEREGLGDAYLRYLLAAHFTTVGTFVPTDVDTRIRFHEWQGRNRAGLHRAVSIVDEVSAWDPRAVSARVVVDEREGTLSGHDGEWLSVRAGALDRALHLRDNELVERLAEQIDGELQREARFVRAALQRGDALRTLCVCTTVAHNTGDLSRVVEAWPARGAESPGGRLARRFTGVGHRDAARYDGLLLLAGSVNKAVMALENHRYLALRRARALRTDRALLLPFPPFLDAWGAALGRHPALARGDKSEALAALLEGHDADPTQQAWLRAMAGLHATHRGGLEDLAGGVPARTRKLLSAGPVRDALRLDAERFHARMAKRLQSALASFEAEAPEHRAALQRATR